MTKEGRPSGPQTSLSIPRIVANPWVVLLVLVLGFFMILLDTTIVNVAIPSIITGLHSGLDEVLWILNAYVLVYAILLITAGRLGDMFGPKRLFISGLVLFTAASAACGLAQSPTELIVFRIIQGVGGAMLTPQSMSIITSLFPPEKRGGAFGVWAAAAGVAAAAGPSLGGLLTTAFSWRAIFYVNVPIGIVAVTLAWLMMPELTNHRTHRLDVTGVALASLGLFGLVFGFIEGQRYDWGPISTFGAFQIGSVRASVWSIPTVLVAGAVFLVAFVAHEARHVEGEPLLPMSLFKDRNFSIANAISTIVAFGMLGMFLPLTIFLQSVLHLRAVNAGVVFVPMSLTMMVVSPIAGRLVERLGKWILAFGLLFYATGMGLVIAVASLSAQGTTFTLPLVLAGVGMGCVFAPMITLAMRNVSPAQAGAASGFINTVRQVGAAFGSSIVGAVLYHQLSIDLKNQAIKYAPQLPPQARGAFISGFAHAASSGLQVGRGQTGAALPKNVPAGLASQIQNLGNQVFEHAFVLAMKPALAVCIVVLLFGVVVTSFMVSPKKRVLERPLEQRGGVAAAGE
jgi:EmrB/QacA subfamily drug resistance transporter